MHLLSRAQGRVKVIGSHRHIQVVASMFICLFGALLQEQCCPAAIH